MKEVEVTRPFLYRTAVDVFLANPLGHGYGSGRFSVGTALGVREYSVHNFWLGMAIEQGFLGLIAALWLTWSTLRQSWRIAVSRAVSPQSKALAMGLFVGLVGLWVNSLFHSMLGWTPVWLIFSMLSALVFFTESLADEASGGIRS